MWGYRYRWGPSGRADSSGSGSDSRSCPCPWRYALAILQQPMVRTHLDVALPGSGGRWGTSSAPAGGHVHRRCSTLRAVLDPARSAQPAADLAWGWDQAALAQSFSTMGLMPPVSTEWIADSGASFHTTPDAGILSSVRPPHPSCSFSIMVGDGSCLSITAVGSAPDSFHLPNVLVAHQMVHNLLSIRQFTADNSCSIEFDSSSLTV